MAGQDSQGWFRRVQGWLGLDDGSSQSGGTHPNHPFRLAVAALEEVSGRLEADFQRERIDRYRALSIRIFEQTVSRDDASATLRKTVDSVEETTRIIQEFVSLAELGVTGPRRTRLLQRIETYLDRVVDEAEQALEGLFDARLDNLSIDLELQEVVRGANRKERPRRLHARQLRRGERITMEEEFPGKRNFGLTLSWKIKDVPDRSHCVVRGRCIPLAERDRRGRGYKLEMAQPPRGDDLLLAEVALRAIPAEIQRIVVVLEIERAGERGHDFSQVEELTLRLLDQAGLELAWYRDDGEFVEETAVAVAELYKRSGQWRLRVRAEGSKAGIEGLRLPG
jgi:hypothetical protein